MSINNIPQLCVASECCAWLQFFSGDRYPQIEYKLMTTLSRFGESVSFLVEASASNAV